MIVVGLNHGELNSSAAICEDGRIIAGAPEERFNRQKLTRLFPYQAMRYCLEHAGIQLQNVNCVAQAWNPGALWAKYNPPAHVKLDIVRIAGTGKRDGLAYGFRAISRMLPDENAVVAVIDGGTVLGDGVVVKQLGIRVNPDADIRLSAQAARQRETLATILLIPSTRLRSASPASEAAAAEPK